MQTVTIDGHDGIALAADVLAAAGTVPVVLLHGGGQTRHAWGATAQALADAGWPTTVVDLRGHGESAWAPDGDYTIEAFARDVPALVAAQAAPPVLVGASLGGVATLTALAADPELALAGVVLVDTAHRLDLRGVRRVADFMRSRMAGFDHAEEAADAVSDYLPHRERTGVSPGLARNLRVRDGRLHWHWDPALVTSFPDQMEPDNAAERHRVLGEVVARLRVPALLVRGGDSDVITDEIAAEFDAIAPTGDVVTIPGARHMIAGDSNAPFTAAVLDFLERRIR